MTKKQESIKFVRLLGENGKYYSLAQHKWVRDFEEIVGETILST